MIAEFILDLLCIISRIAGNDPVNQCAGEDAAVVNPCSERIAEFPEVDILHDAFLQLDAVVVDQFDRQHDQTLFRITAECFETGKKELCQFGREGDVQLLFELVIRIVYDACFRCVGNDEAQGGNLRDIDVFLIITERGNNIFDRSDLSCFNIRFALYAAAKLKGILAILLLEHCVHITERNRADQYDASVKQTLFVCDVDHIVDKRTKEVSFTKLCDLDRTICRFCQFLVDLLHTFSSFLSAFSFLFQLPRRRVLSSSLILHFRMRFGASLFFPSIRSIRI